LNENREGAKFFMVAADIPIAHMQHGTGLSTRHARSAEQNSWSKK